MWDWWGCLCTNRPCSALVPSPLLPNGTLTLFTFPFSLSLQTLYLRALYIHPPHSDPTQALLIAARIMLCARDLFFSSHRLLLPSSLFSSTHEKTPSLSPRKALLPFPRGPNIYDLYPQIFSLGTLCHTTSICLLSVSVPTAWVAYWGSI